MHANLTALPAEIINTSSISSEMKKVLLIAFIALAIFAAWKGRKNRLADTGALVLIALGVVVIAGMGVLVGTDAGSRILSSFFNIGN